MSAAHISWYTVRASGYTALVLLTLSMVLGLLMSLRVQSPRWPRYFTNELHAFVTLVALVFIGVHIAATIVDPYIHFGLSGSLIPFATAYQTLGMALGIVGAYLMLAVWISSKLQRQLGWRAWRAVHYSVFGVYALAVAHTIMAGEDGGTGWGEWITIGSMAIVCGLTALRMVDTIGRWRLTTGHGSTAG
jgi:predicted ferric reductase